MAKDWISKAVPKKNRGKFKAKAKKAGESTAEFADQVIANPENYSEKTVKQAHLAKTLMKMEDGGHPMLKMKNGGIFHTYSLGQLAGDLGKNMVNTALTPINAISGQNLGFQNFQTEVGQSASDFYQSNIAPTYGTVSNMMIGSATKGLISDKQKPTTEMTTYKQGGRIKGFPVEVEGNEHLKGVGKFKGASHDKGGIKTILPENSLVIPKKYTKEYEDAKNRKDGVRTKSIEKTVENNQIQRLRDVKNRKYNKAGASYDSVNGMLKAEDGLALYDNEFGDILKNQFEPSPELIGDTSYQQNYIAPITKQEIIKEPKLGNSIDYSKLASSALQYAPAAMNAFYAMQKVEPTKPTYNPRTKQIESYIDKQQIDLSPLTQSINTAFANQRKDLKTSGSISSGAYKSNMAQLGVAEASSRSNALLQAQQAKNQLNQYKAGAYQGLGTSEQQAQLLADEYTNASMIAKRNYANAAAKNTQEATYSNMLMKLYERQYPLTQK